MRDAISTAEARTASEIQSEARGLQAGHGGALLASSLRALRCAGPGLAGASAPSGAGQLVLH